MSPGLILKSYRVARKVVTPLARRCVVRLTAATSLTSDRNAETQGTDATVSNRFQSAPEQPTVPLSPALRYILGERSEIYADFKATARLGFMPAEALIRRLHANHLDELAEERRQLGELEQQLEVHLRRLDALFPAPLPPEPEPPVPPAPPPPPPPRHFGRVSDVFARPCANTRH